MKTLSNKEKVIRNYWLKYIFFPLVKHDNTNFDYEIIQAPSKDDAFLAAEKIYDNFCECRFLSIDYDLVTLATVGFKPSMTNTERFPNYTVDMVCTFLASICQEKGIYWNDYTGSKYTVQEIASFKGTALGKALSDFDCYVSQDPKIIAAQQNMAAQQTQTKGTARTHSANTGTSTSAGSQLYLSTAHGLIDQTKRHPNVNYMYWISGDFVNINAKTKVRVHVKPLKVQQPLNVYINGSGQGYDDCILYYDDYDAALKASVLCTQNKPAAVSGYVIKKVSTDTNGYFEVDTIYGRGLIVARKLHEALVKAEQEQLQMQEELDAYDKELAEEAQSWSNLSEQDYRSKLNDLSEFVSRHCD